MHRCIPLDLLCFLIEMRYITLKTLATTMLLTWDVPLPRMSLWLKDVYAEIRHLMANHWKEWKSDRQVVYPDGGDTAAARHFWTTQIIHSVSYTIYVVRTTVLPHYQCSSHPKLSKLYIIDTRRWGKVNWKLPWSIKRTSRLLRERRRLSQSIRWKWTLQWRNQRVKMKAMSP